MKLALYSYLLLQSLKPTSEKCLSWMSAMGTPEPVQVGHLPWSAILSCQLMVAPQCCRAPFTREQNVSPPFYVLGFIPWPPVEPRMHPTVPESSLDQLAPSDSVWSFCPSPLDSNLIHLYFFSPLPQRQHPPPLMQIDCWNHMGGSRQRYQLIINFPAQLNPSSVYNLTETVTKTYFINRIFRAALTIE